MATCGHTWPPPLICLCSKILSPWALGAHLRWAGCWCLQDLRPSHLMFLDLLLHLPGMVSAPPAESDALSSPRQKKSGPDFSGIPGQTWLTTQEWARILKILKAWQFPACCFQKPAHTLCALHHTLPSTCLNFGWDPQLRVAQTLFVSQEKQILEGSDSTE